MTGRENLCFHARLPYCVHYGRQDKRNARNTYGDKRASIAEPSRAGACVVQYDLHEPPASTSQSASQLAHTSKEREDGTTAVNQSECRDQERWRDSGSSMTIDFYCSVSSGQRSDAVDTAERLVTHVCRHKLHLFRPVVDLSDSKSYSEHLDMLGCCGVDLL